MKWSAARAFCAAMCVLWSGVHAQYTGPCDVDDDPTTASCSACTGPGHDLCTAGTCAAGYHTYTPGVGCTGTCNANDDNSIAFCKACTADGAAGCTDGTCMPGYHTYAAGLSCTACDADDEASVLSCQYCVGAGAANCLSGTCTSSAMTYNSGTGVCNCVPLTLENVYGYITPDDQYLTATGDYYTNTDPVTLTGAAGDRYRLMDCKEGMHAGLTNQQTENNFVCDPTTGTFTPEGTRSDGTPYICDQTCDITGDGLAGTPYATASCERCNGPGVNGCVVGTCVTPQFYSFDGSVGGCVCKGRCDAVAGSQHLDAVCSGSGGGCIPYAMGTALGYFCANDFPIPSRTMLCDRDQGVYGGEMWRSQMDSATGLATCVFEIIPTDEEPNSMCTPCDVDDTVSITACSKCGGPGFVGCSEGTCAPGYHTYTSGEECTACDTGSDPLVASCDACGEDEGEGASTCTAGTCVNPNMEYNPTLASDHPGISPCGCFPTNAPNSDYATNNITSTIAGWGETWSVTCDAGFFSATSGLWTCGTGNVWSGAPCEACDVSTDPTTDTCEACTGPWFHDCLIGTCADGFHTYTPGQGCLGTCEADDDNSVASCTKCTAGGVAGCTNGTCAVGFHTYVPGQPCTACNVSSDVSMTSCEICTGPGTNGCTDGTCATGFHTYVPTQTQGCTACDTTGDSSLATCTDCTGPGSANCVAGSCATSYGAYVPGQGCTACEDSLTYECSACASQSSVCTAGQCKTGYHTFVPGVWGFTVAARCTACDADDDPTVATCIACTAAGTAGCTGGTCATGYHSYNSGSCTACDVPNPSVSACLACTDGGPSGCTSGSCTNSAMTYNPNAFRCECTDTPVPGSDYATSFTLVEGDTATVTCNTGLHGGGTWTCNTDGTMSGTGCTACDVSDSTGSLASCEACTGAGVAGCTSGTPAAGFHTYTPGAEATPCDVDDDPSIAACATCTGPGSAGCTSVGAGDCANPAMTYVTGQSCQCAPSEVVNTDYATAGSLTGPESAVVTVTCVTGYHGGGDWTCGSDGSFSGSGCTACDAADDATVATCTACTSGGAAGCSSGTCVDPNHQYTPRGSCTPGGVFTSVFDFDTNVDAADLNVAELESVLAGFGCVVTPGTLGASLSSKKKAQRPTAVVPVMRAKQATSGDSVDITFETETVAECEACLAAGNQAALNTALGSTTLLSNGQSLTGVTSTVVGNAVVASPSPPPGSPSPSPGSPSPPPGSPSPPPGSPSPSPGSGCTGGPMTCGTSMGMSMSMGMSVMGMAMSEPGSIPASSLADSSSSTSTDELHSESTVKDDYQDETIFLAVSVGGFAGIAAAAVAFTSIRNKTRKIGGGTAVQPILSPMNAAASRTSSKGAETIL